MQLSPSECVDLDLQENECLVSHSAILNQFLCGDGTKVGQSAKLVAVSTSAVSIDLVPVVCS